RHGGRQGGAHDARAGHLAAGARAGAPAGRRALQQRRGRRPPALEQRPADEPLGADPHLVRADPRRSQPLSVVSEWTGCSLLVPMEKVFESYVEACLRRHLPPGATLKTPATSEWVCRTA